MTSLSARSGMGQAPKQSRIHGELAGVAWFHV